MHLSSSLSFVSSSLSLSSSGNEITLRTVNGLLRHVGEVSQALLHSKSLLSSSQIEALHYSFTRRLPLASWPIWIVVVIRGSGGGGGVVRDLSRRHCPRQPLLKRHLSSSGRNSGTQSRSSTRPIDIDILENMLPSGPEQVEGDVSLLITPKIWAHLTA